jgi:hypothetical protein
LGELQLVAAVHGAQWSALVLPREHSLVPYLCAAGLLVAPIGEHVIIERDPRIEDVVATSASVYREASAYLSTAATHADVASAATSRPLKMTSPKIT